MEKGLTVKEASRLLKLSTHQLYCIERGEAGIPAHRADLFAEVLGVTPETNIPERHDKIGTDAIILRVLRNAAGWSCAEVDRKCDFVVGTCYRLEVHGQRLTEAQAVKLGKLFDRPGVMDDTAEAEAIIELQQKLKERLYVPTCVAN